MKLSELTSALICVSEKAANVARTIRSEHALFSLLVEEKKGEQKNKRFVQDFKTLTDVLVQEIVKHELGNQFPGIVENIYGEESNKFTNVNGESITVEVKSTLRETADLLVRVLDGNSEAAGLLAELVHRDCTQTPPPELCAVDAEIPTSDVGVWIDPIDSTAQYISGNEGHRGPRGVYEDGLPCVVVLIGAYLQTTGQPVCGVANQPFSAYDKDQKRWQGRSVWGLNYNGLNITNAERSSGDQGQAATHQPCIVMSTSESQQFKSTLEQNFQLTYAAGAGYKMLCVIDGLVDAYVLSQGSTFKWDTCGPHALLKCLGGSLVDFTKMRKQGFHSGDAVVNSEVLYNKPDKEGVAPGQLWSNSGGIIAFRSKDFLFKVIEQLPSFK